MKWMVLCGCLFVCLNVQAATKIGWIDSLQPAGAAAESVSIQREGKVILFSPANRLLYEGDQITLAKEGLSLKIVVGESTVFVKSEQARPGAPYVVKLAGEIPTVQKNLLDWISDKLKGKDAERSPAKTISASSRAIKSLGLQPLSAPIIDQANVKLASGERDILFVWQGGTPPYRIIVNQGGKETVAENLSDPNHSFAKLSLSEGSLQLRLEDSKGRRYADSVTVVPEATRPAMPAPLREAKLDTSVRNHLYGEWLIEQGNDWALEALQWQERQ